MKALLVCLLILGLSHASMFLTEIQEKRLDKELGLDEDYFWFNQKKDHFDPLEKDTWDQRYYDISDYWDPQTGPLFLYIGGEGTLRKPSDNGFAVALAKNFKGRLLALEHRFYGQSQPTYDWSTYNLQFLTPDQGLADLANFATNKSAEFAQEHGIPHRRWIVIGGSYPGAMSAWFRYKYPHIAFGSLASSAVVEAIADYHQYDEQVYTSTLRSGEACPDKWMKAIDYIEFEVARGNRDLLHRKFGFAGDDLPDGAFNYFIGDIVAGAVQTGTRSTFCDTIAAQTDDPEQFVDWLALDYTHQIGLNLGDYSYGYLKDSVIDVSRNARQWTWQTCSNLGYFQTPAEVGPKMRPDDIKIDFWKQYCQGIFDTNVFPDTAHWNTLYGGKDLAGSKIIFTNGIEDPWQHASVTETQNPDLTPIVIDCPNCAHCVELHDLKDTDAPELVAARAKVTEILGTWIASEMKGEAKFPKKTHAILRELLA